MNGPVKASELLMFRNVLWQLPGKIPLEKFNDYNGETMFNRAAARYCDSLKRKHRKKLGSFMKPISELIAEKCNAKCTAELKVVPVMAILVANNPDLFHLRAIWCEASISPHIEGKLEDMDWEKHNLLFYHTEFEFLPIPKGTMFNGKRY